MIATVLCESPTGFTASPRNIALARLCKLQLNVPEEGKPWALYDGEIYSILQIVTWTQWKCVDSTDGLFNSLCNSLFKFLSFVFLFSKNGWIDLRKPGPTTAWAGPGRIRKGSSTTSSRVDLHPGPPEVLFFWFSESKCREVRESWITWWNDGLMEW